MNSNPEEKLFGTVWIVQLTFRKKDAIIKNVIMKHPNYLNVNQSYRKGDLLPKPSQFDRMKEIAGKLSQSFPVVRVDLFEVNGKVYFGEMTFTSVGGMNSQYSKEFLLKAGSLITL